MEFLSCDQCWNFLFTKKVFSLKSLAETWTTTTKLKKMVAGGKGGPPNEGLPPGSPPAKMKTPDIATMASGGPNSATRLNSAHAFGGGTVR